MTLQVDNIAKADGSKSVATDYVIDGSAKVWGKFDGSDTVLDNSFNTSSITDRGAGQYTLNFTNALSSGNYGYSVAASMRSSGGSDSSAGGLSSSSLPIRIVNNSWNYVDLTDVGYTVHGDLA